MMMCSQGKAARPRHMRTVAMDTFIWGSSRWIIGVGRIMTRLAKMARLD